MGPSVPLDQGRAALVRGLQERAAWAQPPVAVTERDGWWLRDAPGCGWWVGTTLPHRDATADALARRIAEVEEHALARGTAAGFQISPPACPAELDKVLAKRAYRRTDSLSLQVAATANVLAEIPATNLRVQLDDRPTRAWFAVWEAVHGHGGHQPKAEWAMLHRVVGPSAYASVTLGTTVVAVGRAVADAGWAGVFGIATLPAARAQGAARTVLAALADWAGGRSAGRLYLQVERDNDPATRLYRNAGFTELYDYHYRIAPRPTGAGPDAGLTSRDDPDPLPALHR